MVAGYKIHQASKHLGGRKLFKLKNNVGTKTNGNYLAMNVGWKLEEVAVSSWNGVMVGTKRLTAFKIKLNKLVNGIR